MTSSSDWDRRFFFFTPELPSDGLLLLDTGWADTPLLLLLTVFPLLVTDRTPLEWATPTEDGSTLGEPFRQDSSVSRSCPAPLACMLTRFIRLTRWVWKQMTGAKRQCGDYKTTGTAADRPTDPDAAPNCPVPLRPSLPVCSRRRRRQKPGFRQGGRRNVGESYFDCRILGNSAIFGAVMHRFSRVWVAG